MKNAAWPNCPEFSRLLPGQVDLMTRVCRAVHHAHQRGILHRDLKPANILLEKPAHAAASAITNLHTVIPMVADFGLAKQVEGDSDLTGTGNIVGTPAYMPPEQALGKKDLTTGVDVYSLGAIFYELLTGRPPFRGTNPIDTLRQTCEEEPQAPHLLNPRVPRDLEIIALKYLRKEPAARYGSAEELAQDLERWSTGQPILARAAGRWERLAKWVRRRPAIAMLSGALLLALVLGIGTFLWQYGQVVRARDEASELADKETKAKNEARTLLASLATERGLLACRQGDIGQGMHWLVRGLATAPDQADYLRHTVRANLAAWLPHLHTLHAAWEQKGYVWAVAYQPGGTLVATASDDGAVRLWDRNTGQAFGKPLQHQGPVRALAFSPDGKLLATGSQDLTARVWDVATTTAASPPLEHQGWVRALAFHPQGQFLATGSADKTARLWEVPSGQPIGQPLHHQGEVLALAFHPQGQTLLTGSTDQSARLWNTATGKNQAIKMEHQGVVWTVAFSPDGALALTGSWDHTARIWDAATGKPRGAPLHHQGNVRVAQFSSDGKIILTASEDRTARIWDAATGQALGVPLVHEDEVLGAALDPKGARVATAGPDRTVRLWDWATGKLSGSTLEHGAPPTCLAFSPDGADLLTGDANGTSHLWKLSPGPRRQSLNQPGVIWTTVYSRNGKVVLTAGGDGSAWLWDPANAQPLGPALKHQRPVRAAAFSHDGRTIATASGNMVHLWTEAGAPVGQWKVAQGLVWALDFTPDDKGLVLASGDQAQVFDWYGRPQGLAMMHEGDVVTLATNGKHMLTGSRDRTARLWEISSGKLVGAPWTHRERVSAVALSPNGELAATASEDGLVRLWNVAQVQMIGQPLQQRKAARTLAFAPDGQSLLSGGEDRLLYRWDVNTGKLIGMPLPQPGVAHALACRPDGKQVALATQNGAALLELSIPMTGEPAAIQRRLEALTGSTLDPDGVLQILSPGAWRERPRE
jgi:WD40 repeat protein